MGAHLMHYPEIKSKLSLESVLSHYGIKYDSRGKALCPWHNDKTPSLQLYFNTNSWTCFSGKCKAGSGDVIDLIRLMEGCTPHEAILKAKTLVGQDIIVSRKQQSEQVSEEERTHLLSKAFVFFGNALKQTKAASAYLEKRGLFKGIYAQMPIEVGYNGARFHYRAGRRGLNEQEKATWIKLGMMKPLGTGEANRQTYQSWAKDCVVFPLKNKKHQVVSFYGRSVVDEGDQKHYYLKERQGLYPQYPSIEKRLILTESVIDTASLMVADIIDDEMGVLACYGTNGLTAEHVEAIKSCKNLLEVIFFFDGDSAGLSAIDKHSKQLAGLEKELTISKVNTPEGEDINSLHLGHEPTVFKHLLENRTVLHLAKGKSDNLFSFNGINNGNNNGAATKTAVSIEKGQLYTAEPQHILYENERLRLHIWGGIDTGSLAKLRISLHVELKGVDNKSFRDEVNLYSFSQVKRISRHISEQLGISTTYVSKVLADLTSQLESYRLKLKNAERKRPVDERIRLSPQQRAEAMKFLKSPKLLRKTLELIEQSGLVGQQKNGLLLFLLYLSRFFASPLHAIIFGKSGSGKTWLQTKISDCLPPEDLRVVTSLTENTLYYSPQGFWKHKVLVIEDLEGVYQAFLPLRELMSKQEISKFTTDKDRQGNNVQLLLKVEGPICISGATTKEWIYEDNANRSYLLHIDESKSHLATVMEYQRKEYAGLLNKKAQEKAQILLQNVQRLLSPITVINPYAEQLILPDKVFKKLRTNMHYLKLIQLITFYAQHSREVKKTAEGVAYIESTINDIAWANRLIKESLLRKSDELSGKLRSFFETLKTMMEAKDKSEQSFYAKQIRAALRMNPMMVNRYLRELEMRSYIRRIGGNRKTGYEYQIELWEEYEALQAGIDLMDKNLDKIKAKVNGQVATSQV